MAVGNPILTIAQPFARQTTLNVTAKTLIKAGPGYVEAVIVNTTNSAAGGVYDSATTGGTAAANQIAPIANAVAVGQIKVQAYFKNGLVVDPGTGGKVVVTFQ